MRRLVVLVVLVAGVAAYLFLYDVPKEQRENEREAIERQLMMFNPSSVDTLRFDRDEGRLTLARDGETWWLLEPVREVADQAAVAGELRSLLEAERVRPLATEDANEDLSVFGLGGVGQGTAVVTVTSAGGEAAVLHVGQTNPEGTATYVQRGPGAPVELADGELYSLVRVSHQAFRVHDLFAVGDTSIVAVKVAAGGAPYAAHRDQEGLWHLDPPDGRRLQRWAMRSLAYDLSTARVERFAADHVTDRDMRGYGLHEPAADVSFQSTDGVSHRLRIGNEGPDQLVYGRRDDESTVFLMSSQVLTTAERPLAELLDKSLFAMNFDRIDSVSITWESGASFGIAHVGQGYEPRPMSDDAVFVESLRTPMRNVMLGLERTNSLGTMLLAEGSTAAQVLTKMPIRCAMHWPDRTIRFTLGWRSGEEFHWLHVDGAQEMVKVPRDLFFRLRGFLVSAKRIDGL